MYIWLCCSKIAHWYRADSRFAPSQWETSLQSNAVSHWLGANLESAPVQVIELIVMGHVAWQLLLGTIPVSSRMFRSCQGWGLLSQFPPFRYFPASPKYMLAIEYHIYIWKLSQQPIYGDTCQIWMWCKGSNRYFGGIEKMLTEKLTDGALVTPALDWLECGSGIRLCQLPYHQMGCGDWGTRCFPMVAPWATHRIT